MWLSGEEAGALALVCISLGLLKGRLAQHLENVWLLNKGWAEEGSLLQFGKMMFRMCIHWGHEHGLVQNSDIDSQELELGTGTNVGSSSSSYFTSVSKAREILKQQSGCLVPYP
jgi:hypothetical protein